MSFRNQIAVITGAARGVGKVVATRFARSGATAVLIDLDQEEAEEVAQQLKEEGFQAEAFNGRKSNPPTNSRISQANRFNV